MDEIDYTIESEDETDEDAFEVGPSDKRVNELLAEARKQKNVDLRRALKELLYARYLMEKLFEFVIEEEGKHVIHKLGKAYVEGTKRANNLDARYNQNESIEDA